ncbi:MAG: hypothetical protein RIS47_1649 [Bacteroidota bacterium]
MADKKLFLFDAYALIYRAHFAFIQNPRINSKGINTSAVLGFANTLEEVFRKEKPTHAAVAFDTPDPTFRHKMYDQYKAQRPPMPEDIQIAVPYIRKYLAALNIPIVEMSGWEADDVVGTLAHQAAEQGFDVYMMTPDKDYCQLVKENVWIYKPKSKGKEVEIWGIPEVCEAYNISDPIQIIDVLSLWGDASDNVPGADGVGEKGSKEIIGKYGSVDAMYAHINDFKGKKKDKILASKDNVYRALQLITIDTKVPVQFDEALFSLKDPNKPELKLLLEELEFRALATRLLGTSDAPPQQAGLFDTLPGFGAPAQTDEPAAEELPTSFATSTEWPHEYILVNDADAIHALIKSLELTTEFCFDTETTGTDVHTAELVGMSFCWEAHKAYYIPVPANQQEAHNLLSYFKPIFANNAIGKIGQNIKFDLQMLASYGVEIAGKLFDTMIAHYLLEPDMRHNMNALSENYLGYSPIKIETLIGEKGKSQGTMRDVPLDKIAEYAAEDADITWQLAQIFRTRLEKENLLALFNQIEMPLIPVLAKMERTGVCINTPALADYAVELQHDIQTLEAELIEMAGEPFNPASPKQLGEILFDKLKLDPMAKKTEKSNQYATNEKVLQKLSTKHPIINKILDYRELRKLLSTYVEALPLLVNERTGRVHTSYNQAVAATGRLSSTDPNLQNIPVRTTKGRELRKAFIPSDAAHQLLSADYSQIELRIIAHLSGDSNMVEAFRNGYDIHAATAAKIYNIPIEEVSREMRSNAKGANFGIVYGISSFGLAENLGISRTEAKMLIDGYFANYPGVKVYMDKCVATAREHGYVSTLMGRKRYLPDINSANGMGRGMAERNAINAPIQGSAADIIKLAMIRIDAEFTAQNIQSTMTMQVHDELVFDVLETEIDTVKEIVIRQMEAAVALSVPLTAEAGIGHNWLEAH